MPNVKENLIIYARSLGLSITYDFNQTFPWITERIGQKNVEKLALNASHLSKSFKREIAEQFRELRWAQNIIHELENNWNGNGAVIRSWLNEEIPYPSLVSDIRDALPSAEECLPRQWKKKYHQLVKILGPPQRPITGHILSIYRQDPGSYHALCFLFPREGFSRGRPKNQRVGYEASPAQC